MPREVAYYFGTNPEARLLKKVNRRIGFSAKSISYTDIAQESIIGLKSYQFCIENLTFNIMIYILVFIEIDHDFILRTDALGPCSDHSLGPCGGRGQAYCCKSRRACLECVLILAATVKLSL